MANDEFINQIADKLQNHASEVNPQMWQAISSQIGAAGAGATGATALGFGKVAAIVIGTAVVAVASYFAVNSTSSEKQDRKELAKVVQVEPTEKLEENTVVAEQQSTIQPIIEVEKERVQNTKNKTTETAAKPETTEVVPVVEQKNPGITEIKMPVVVEPIRTIKKSTTISTPTEVTEVRSNKVDQTTVEKIVSNEGSKVDEKKASFGITKLPNVFSPNNDGINDYLTVETKGLSNYSLVVLDKNNTKVWQTTEPNAKWDGRDMSGQFVEPGDYIYFVAADGPNGEKIGKYQRLTITK